MRSTLYLFTAILAAVVTISFSAGAWAGDYNARFVRNYPPGYYGMWYKAERFHFKREEGKVPDELYRWDRYMRRVTDLDFPYLPAPFAWDYGTQRTFNLPEYNTNDWD